MRFFSYLVLIKILFFLILIISQLHIDELQKKAQFYHEKLEAMSAQVEGDKLMKQLKETLEKNVNIIQEIFETSIQVT